MPFLSKTTVISRFKCSVLRVLVSIYVHLQFEISIRTIRSLLVACEAPRRLKKKKKLVWHVLRFEVPLATTWVRDG